MLTWYRGTFHHCVSFSFKYRLMFAVLLHIDYCVQLWWVELPYHPFVYDKELKFHWHLCILHTFGEMSLWNVCSIVYAPIMCLCMFSQTVSSISSYYTLQRCCYYIAMRVLVIGCLGVSGRAWAYARTHPRTLGWKKRIDIEKRQNALIMIAILG